LNRCALGQRGLPSYWLTTKESGFHPGLKAGVKAGFFGSEQKIEYFTLLDELY
jgi:hypothetical protein